jgi:hypothetical protein
MKGCTVIRRRGELGILEYQQSHEHRQTYCGGTVITGWVRWIADRKTGNRRWIRTILFKPMKPPAPLFCAKEAPVFTGRSQNRADRPPSAHAAAIEAAAKVVRSAAQPPMVEQRSADYFTDAGD